ncbi:MAG TPA: DUF2723 domain-containing protein [Anaerolineae bacterium]
MLKMQPKSLLARAGGVVRRYPGLVLVLAAAVLYLLTLQDGLQPYQLLGGDLITHQYAQVQGRFSNAPGYPLYTMGGWLWFHGLRGLLGPGANPVPILSSYSTLWALVALWFLYLLILEVTDRGEGGNRPVALLTGAFYAVTYFFWYYAVTTEEYASAVAWTLAVFWLAFRWERTRQDRYLLWISLLGGVALAHMLTLPLVIPPLLVFVLVLEPSLLRRPRLVAGAIGLALLPLVSYAYVYLAGAAHPEWRGVGQWSSNWDWFLSFVATKQGLSELTWSWTPFFTAEFPSLIWRELTWPGLLAGLAGLALLKRSRALVIFAGLAVYLAFCWIDRMGNWFQVIMPAYALVVVGLAVAADVLWRWSKPAAGASPAAGLAAALRRGTPALVLAALAALALYRGIASYPRAALRNRADATGLAPGWAILADAPPAGAAVLATLPEDLALDYLINIWGMRPDLRTVTAPEARSVFATHAPLVVTAGFLPLAAAEISPQAHYSALGPAVVALSATPVTVPPAGLTPRNEDFGGSLRLVGTRLLANRATGEQVALLAWQAEPGLDRDLSISVRLTRNGDEVVQLDHAAPVAGAYPTSGWTAGEVVTDAYPFMLPPGPPPDGITIIVYYQEAGGKYINLRVARLPLAPS